MEISKKMDPALMREREAFMRRAIAQPTIEKKRPTNKASSSSEPPKKKSKPQQNFSSQGTSLNSTNYRFQSGSSKYRFGVLAKIVNFMKARHQQGDSYPLTIDEIMDETNQLDIGQTIKTWLVNEALPNNPKIKFEDGKYVFQPAYNLKSRKDLHRLLNKRDQQGLGGIMMDDVMESLPHAQVGLKKLAEHLIILTRPDKKKVVYFNDKTFKLQIDEEFKELWNSTPVDSLDEEKIEDYLKKQGINSMQDHGPKKFSAPQRKKPNRKVHRKFKKLNDHVQNILKDYSDEKK
ncbi:general transcription factor IIE subunit 2-like [Diadema setosum]|uniref:general transcription factor IIE subunit 2-like n=1 Tax=Diadema setosum TaxID=31175 RepID=UPI003B3B2BEF